MTLLAGQKILLIGIGFYDYETAIAAEFRILGGEVRVEDQRPPEMRGWRAGLHRRFFPNMAKAQARHLNTMLERARADGALDHVLVIKGALLSDGFLRALRKAQPNAQFIAYHWDSMARYPALIQRQELFDRVLTFDHDDAAKFPSFILRPLFFRREITQSAPSGERKVDICFVGWLHHQRLQQIEAIQAQIAEIGRSGSYYLSTGIASYMKLSLTGRGRNVHPRTMPFNTYANTMANSNVILDLPHPQQSGLTMRAIETIGSGKKLITTSRDIVHYDFYRPENISIINAEEPRLDFDFLIEPPVQIAPHIVEKYSLNCWIKNVCGIE